MQINEVVLQGQGVRLEPVNESHIPGLAAAIEDGRLWEIPVTLVPHPSKLSEFVLQAQTAYAQQRELAFATIDVQSGRVVGSTRFRCIDIVHRRVEIGFTFLAASWQRTHINTAAKYLMLQHAFEVWGCNRVELLTDERNTQSRKAIQRIGAQYEGILRSHMVMRDGFLRNSVVYSIVKPDWPDAKAALASKQGMSQ